MAKKPAKIKDYNHLAIEKKWQKMWDENKTYKTLTATTAKGKKPFYILDMFPYPSGAGLHVGHPRGYIGSDVLAHQKRMQGYNVLHPMGYDAFGLPAEQYAITHKVHPKRAVEINVKTFEKQLSAIGLSYDWTRRINTTDPEYYKWTQWIFLQLYNSYYDVKKNKALSIDQLVKIFETKGNQDYVKNGNAYTTYRFVFSGLQWKGFTELKKQEILMHYRLAYEADSEVNWCQELGTVLANDEIVDKDGKQVSERGDYPVEKMTIRQWSMRITAYAERLISGLETIDFPEHIKTIQNNWIGKSIGAEVDFVVQTINTATENKSKITIQLANQIDAKTMAEINTMGWLENNISSETGFTKEFLEKERGLVFPIPEKNIQKIQNKIKDNPNNFIVAKLFDDVVGWLGFQEKENGQIEFGVYVHTNLTGKGIGTLLMNYLFEKYPTKEFEIEVTKTNERAIKLYKKLGFEIIRESKFFQKDIKNKYLPVLVMLKRVHKISVFTTRADTLFGVSAVVLAPEHDFIEKNKTQIQNYSVVETYIRQVKNKTNEERTENNEKSGVELKGIKATNPANGEQVPVWIADYVLVSYGTGAVMSVPAHDERDFAFAEKYNLPMKEVLQSTDKQNTVVPFTGEGVLINSGKFTGMDSNVARSEIIKSAGGRTITNYKMRDAIFARQRYWGEPIPLYRDKNGIIHEVKKLPLELPNVKSYEPTGKAEGPLAGVKAWTDKGYETNTMPGWAGSSWYFLRYMDPKNAKALVGEKEIAYWKNVDVYVGGAEHVTGHLLYSRFWHKFLRDIGVVNTEEPFKKMYNQGLILAADGRKMSKRWGNVVNPDDIIKTFGADTLRVYEMFMGPFTASQPWNTESIIGSRRFIERVWRLGQKITTSESNSSGPRISSRHFSPSAKIAQPDRSELLSASVSANTSFAELEVTLHKTIKKVTEDIEYFAFNTAISSLMICLNEFENAPAVPVDMFKTFLQLLAPFAPHVTDELWTIFGGKSSIHNSIWPKYNPKKIVSSTVTIGVQVNGKVRAEIIIPVDSPQSDVESIAMKNEKVLQWLEGKEIKKIIYVPGRLINIAVV